MLRLHFLALLFAANPIYGRPVEDETYQLATSPISCTVVDNSLGLRSETQYTGTCDSTEDDAYVFLQSNTCATASNFKCRVRRMQCSGSGEDLCIDVDKSHTCQPTMDSPIGQYILADICPGNLLCCLGKVLFTASKFRELTASLPADVLNQIAPGAENQFFGQQADNVALLSNNGALYQPFTNRPNTDNSLGPASFSTEEGINFDTFQLDPANPPVFSNDLPDSNMIFGLASPDENKQLSASPSDSDLSLFYSSDG